MLSGASVLIVEDNAILALDMITTLGNAGAAIVGPAHTLEHAVALAKTEPISCGILDVSLRNEAVFPAAELLRNRGVPIVFYTGHGDAEGLRRDWPEAKVLSKPAPPKLLLQTVRNVCPALAA